MATAPRDLRWELAHPASTHRYGYDSALLVGQVCTWDGQRWAAMVHHVRIDDTWYPDVDSAIAAVDAHHSAPRG